MLILPHLALPVNPSEARMQELLIVYAIPVDDLYHTNDQPFCYCDPTCPCHEDPQSIDMVVAWVREGLMTPQEATNFILGRTF